MKADSPLPLATILIQQAQHYSLLQTTHSPFRDGIDEFTLKERIRFFATLTVNGVVAIGDPIQEL